MLAEDFDTVIRNEINMVELCLNKANLMIWNGRECLFRMEILEFKVSNDKLWSVSLKPCSK